MARRPKTSTAKTSGRKPARESKRTLAARKGWATRRANEDFKRRSRAAKKGWRTRRAVKGKKVGRPRQNRKMFLVTIAIDYGRRGESPRKRDLLIPARKGATFRELKAIARDTLPPDAQPLLQFMTKKNTTIAPGPTTRARKATDR